MSWAPTCGRSARGGERSWRRRGSGPSRARWTASAPRRSGARTASREIRTSRTLRRLGFSSEPTGGKTRRLRRLRRGASWARAWPLPRVFWPVSKGSMTCFADRGESDVQENRGLLGDTEHQVARPRGSGASAAHPSASASPTRSESLDGAIADDRRSSKALAGWPPSREPQTAALVAGQQRSGRVTHAGRLPSLAHRGSCASSEGSARCGCGGARHGSLGQESVTNAPSGRPA